MILSECSCIINKRIKDIHLNRMKNEKGKVCKENVTTKNNEYRQVPIWSQE